MEQAKSIVPRLFRGEQRHCSALDLIRAFWADAAGPLLSAHSRPVRFERATVVVEAGDRSWLELLLPMRPQLANDLRERLPHAGIARLEVVLARERARVGDSRVP